jgi:sec-independent protein translocase protein TatA
MILFVLGFGGLGPPEIILIVVALLIFFGGKKIPELMKGLGKGMKEFKKATRDDDDSDTDSKDPKKEKLEE